MVLSMLCWNKKVVKKGIIVDKLCVAEEKHHDMKELVSPQIEPEVERLY